MICQVHSIECAIIRIDAQNKEVRNMYYYQRIRDLREDKDLKQLAIAMVLQITQQQYQLYESGRREIPVHKLIMLADFYGVSLDYLTGRTDKKEINT